MRKSHILDASVLSIAGSLMITTPEPPGAPAPDSAAEPPPPPRFVPPAIACGCAGTGEAP